MNRNWPQHAARLWLSALVRLPALALVLACSPGKDSAPAVEPALAGNGGSAGAAGQEQGGVGAMGAVGAVQPAAHRGRRGLGCSVKNDCAPGLSCIQGVCEPTSFALKPSAKECVEIDCNSSADCCGSLPLDVPEKCRARASTCLPQLPGCVVKECTRTGECAGGGACVGQCAVTRGECRGNVDCLANKCVEGKCSLNFTACRSDAECSPNVCAGGKCACDNPSYDSKQPVCDDPDCDSVCLWACEASRCVIPTKCSTRTDCFGARPNCVAGTCVECQNSLDCSFGKLCIAGNCETQCQSDLQCAQFEACQAGQCLYVGCRSDCECALVPDVRVLGLTPGLDPRLLRCHTDAGVGRCVVPCQIDSQCAATEVCAGGLCQYIGCESSDECATLLGVHQQVTTDTHPWVARVECRADAE